MEGKNLKDARKILGLSQEEMAAKIYVSFPTYNGYENGKNIPKNKHAVITNVLKEASLIKDEQISDEVLKKVSKEILVDILKEIKSLREENIEIRAKSEDILRENKEIKDLLKEAISLNSTESKINELSSGQMNILKKVLQNISIQLEALKKADLKKSASTE